jgi:hypothetical protein
MATAPGIKEAGYGAVLAKALQRRNLQLHLGLGYPVHHRMLNYFGDSHIYAASLTE